MIARGVDGDDRVEEDDEGVKQDRTQSGDHVRGCAALL